MLPGLIGVFLMQYLYTLGSRMTLAANAGIITLTIPVIVGRFCVGFAEGENEPGADPRLYPGAGGRFDDLPVGYFGGEF